MISGIPDSSRSNDAFSGVQGSFFSSEKAPEVILQKSFAVELLGKATKPGEEDEIPVAEVAKPLLGQELTMRYAQRTPAPSSSEEGAAAKAGNQSEDLSDAAYSVLSREQKLKIVGVSDLDPDSMRGAARARVFLPLKLAEDLHVMQPSDLRDSMRGFNRTAQLFHHQRAGEESQAGRSRWKMRSRRLGFNTFSIIDATRRPAAIFRSSRSVSRNFWQPGVGRGVNRDCEHAGDGHSGAPPRNWGIMKASAPATGT